MTSKLRKAQPCERAMKKGLRSVPVVKTQVWRSDRTSCCPRSSWDIVEQHPCSEYSWTIDATEPSGTLWVVTASMPCDEVSGTGNCGLLRCFLLRKSQKPVTSWQSHTGYNERIQLETCALDHMCVYTQACTQSWNHPRNMWRPSFVFRVDESQSSKIASN